MIYLSMVSKELYILFFLSWRSISTEQVPHLLCKRWNYKGIRRAEIELISNAVSRRVTGANLPEKLSFSDHLVLQSSKQFSSRYWVWVCDNSLHHPCLVVNLWLLYRTWEDWVGRMLIFALPALQDLSWSFTKDVCQYIKYAFYN